MGSRAKTTEGGSAAKGPRQQSITGTDGDRIKALDALAEEYVELREKRQQMLGKEVEKRHALEEAMREHEKKVYRSDAAGLVVELVAGGEKAKVTRLGESEES